jgi:hypothetical protein
VENMNVSIHFFTQLTLLTKYHVLTPTSKMVQPRESIDTS